MRTTVLARYLACSIERVKSIICHDVTPCILVGLASRILNLGTAATASTTTSTATTTTTTTTTTTIVTTTANYLFPDFRHFFCCDPYKLCTNK
jgi:hypothetical protein